MFDFFYGTDLVTRSLLWVSQAPSKMYGFYSVSHSPSYLFLIFRFDILPHWGLFMVVQAL